MKKIFLFMLLMSYASLSHAFEKSIYIYDMATGGKVTSSTKQIGAILTLKDPPFKSNAPMTVYSDGGAGISLAGETFQIQATPETKVRNKEGAFPLPNGDGSSASIFLGTYDLGKTQKPKKGIFANFYVDVVRYSDPKVREISFAVSTDTQSLDNSYSCGNCGIK